MMTHTAMTAPQQALYDKIQTFELDEAGVRFPLSRRLAKENGRSQRYTQRAIAEYRKFAFLAAAAGHPVSPSDTVDQVWHLHLLYTRSYWDRFCGDVLGQPLHHMPSMGGGQEFAKFENWYDNTLASYEHFFGPAPTDLWPTPEAKAAQRLQYQWIDRLQHWIIPKPQHWGRLGMAWVDQMGQQKGRVLLGWLAVISVVGIWMLAATPAIASGTLVATTSFNPLNYRGPDFLAFYMILSGLCFGMANLLRHWMLRGSSGKFVLHSIHPYELAYLAEGEQRTVQTAIARLAIDRIINLSSLGEVTLSPSIEKTAGDYEHPLDQAIALTIPPDGRSIQQIARQPPVRAAVAEVERSLRGQRLLTHPRKILLLRLQIFVIMTFPLLLGLAKIGVGLLREKPVDTLVWLWLMMLILTLLTLEWAGRRLTGQGDRLFNQHLKQNRPSNSHADSAEAVLRSYALVGETALPGTFHAGLQLGLERLDPPRQGSISAWFDPSPSPQQHCDRNGCDATSATIGRSWWDSTSSHNHYSDSGYNSDDSSSDDASCGGGCGGCGGD